MTEQSAQIIPPSAPTDAYNRDEVLVKWQEAKKMKESITEIEMFLRKTIVEREFADAKKGTSRVALGNGWQLKAVKKETLSVTKNEADDANPYSHLPGIMGQLPPAIAAKIIKWKPEVDTKTYAALTDAERLIVNQFVLLKDGSPDLVIEEPKA